MKIWKKIVSNVFLLCTGSLCAQTYTLSDTVFGNFLKATYPTTINASGDLVIAEASKITGSFTANKKGISNVDGIQYFVKINSLNLQENHLKFLPDLSNLSNLGNMNLGQNNLIYVPSFSKLKRLKVLDLQKNVLVMFPDLQGTDSLESLFLHYNNIDSVPDLSNLKRLKEIDLQYNQLKSIVGLQDVSSLEILICYKNQISRAFDASKLSQLQQLNMSYNALTVAPTVGDNKRIKLLYANDNLIDSLPDNYATCDSLQNVRLYNNLLTFKELVKLMDKANYDTLIKLNPQPAFAVGTSINARENTIVVLKTGIDAGVPNVFYEWYKNGFFYATTNTDGLPFSHISFGDAGAYSCYIKHTSFHNFYIKTDTFKVSVTPCNDLSKISFTVSDIECLKPGTITVTDLNSASSQNTYILKSTVSSHTVTARKGLFIELTEPSYLFKVITNDGCEKALPTPIVLAQQECEEVLLYPDSEGNNSYYFEQSGEVIIYDKRGSIVKKLATPGAWTGQGTKGQRLPSGFYVADINNGQKLVGITVLY